MQLPWQKKPLALNSPRDLPGLALWLDSKDVSSLRNDAGAQPVTTDGIKLASDKSGNSSTNVLCLNGVAGNYARAPDSVPTSITGTLDVDSEWALNSWASGAIQALCGKFNTTANQRSYSLGVSATGNVILALSADGTAAGAGGGTATSSAATGFSAFSRNFVRATWQQSDGRVQFFTSTDGTNWTQLGTNQTLAIASIFDSTATVEIGSITAGTLNLASGLSYRSRIYSGLRESAGTLAFDANFATASKLAPSFTESSSNAATVTINTSGATGARISGARDLYQGTAANQPILTIAASGNYLTFDGSNDYLKAAAFSLSQPETVYFVGSQVTWTNQDAFLDGNSNATGLLFQRTSTPEVGIFAGASIGNISLALNTVAILTGIYNNTASAIRLNRESPVTGTAGTSGLNGLIVGNRADLSTPANITASEVLVYSGAHDKATQDRVIAYLANRNRIALT